jgi:uncharacterized FlaG/YvyC family protein
MIEAVNSVLSNASSTRAAVEQQSTTRTTAVNPDKVQEVAKTPFVSPYISLDRSSNRAVLQIRDSDTGDVVRQYPTETQLRAYKNAQEASRREEQTIGINTPDESNRPSASTNIETTPVSVDVESVQTEA